MQIGMKPLQMPKMPDYFAGHAQLMILLRKASVQVNLPYTVCTTPNRIQ
jgi:hypothetical protein